MPADRGIVGYFAPGAGLGHINRAAAICLGLRDAGADARIVTDSPFGAGVAALTRCPVIHIDRLHWAESARALVDEIQPRAVITDTFPYGIRDEWRGRRTFPLIHVARRLLRPFETNPADFALTLQVEPLSSAHRAALGDCVQLSGPIRLDPARAPSPIPAALDCDGLTLVVHSGPPEEVAVLEAMAEPPYAVISPWSGIEYYPASHLFARARRIITGAGYNSMADLLPFRHKHTAVPFPRRFDDQHARTREFFTEPADGTDQAVAALIAAL